MDTLHPPYNVTQPRQLVRWLDVNAQNGPLRRTQTYIALPVFNVVSNWLGYSDVVATFNFTVPNNFSLRSVNGLVTSPSYLLCIAYADSNGVTRYALWHNVGEIIYFNLPLYTGQMIKKNFRFEVWNTNPQFYVPSYAADSTYITADSTIITADTL